MPDKAVLGAIQFVPYIRDFKILPGRCPVCKGHLRTYTHSHSIEEDKGVKYVAYVEREFECGMCPFVLHLDYSVLRPPPVKEYNSELGLLDLKCVGCGESFRPHHKNQKYCNENCGAQFRGIRKQSAPHAFWDDLDGTDSTIVEDMAKMVKMLESCP